jgi:hypothetical protein
MDKSGNPFMDILILNLVLARRAVAQRRQVGILALALAKLDGQFHNFRLSITQPAVICMCPGNIIATFLADCTGATLSRGWVWAHNLANS